jgi:hypothetical protein
MGSARRARGAAILALGAFALHQLRYLVAFGSSSSEELARQGHGYLASAAPVLAAMALAALLATALRARFGDGLAKGSIPRRTAVFTLALLGIFSVQESLEGLLAAGHPAGLAAILGGGGYLAIPLAVAIGVLAALLVRALEGVEIALSARRVAPRLPRAPRERGQWEPVRRVHAPRAAMAFGLARRPPPHLPA